MTTLETIAALEKQVKDIQDGIEALKRRNSEEDTAPGVVEETYTDATITIVAHLTPIEAQQFRAKCKKEMLFNYQGAAEAIRHWVHEETQSSNRVA